MRIEAIVLAAGAGARYGGGKLLAPWRGGVLLDGALSAACTAPVQVVHVVWGADPAVEDAVRAFGDLRGERARLRTVYAEHHDAGLSASLGAGIEALSPNAAGAFVFLGDMPRIPAALLGTMADVLASGAQAVAPEFEGRRGHPVLFSRALFAKLRQLTGDKGASGLLHALGDALVRLPVPDDGVLFDVDRPSDLV